MKRRDNQRANRRAKEERLNRTTEWGSADPTARQAVDNIIAEQKALLRAVRAKVKVKNKITAACRQRREGVDVKTPV